MNPENITHFQCSILAVRGTKDARVDYYPNIEKKERLLKKGSNLNCIARISDEFSS
jgi:hypothetical protein